MSQRVVGFGCLVAFCFGWKSISFACKVRLQSDGQAAVRSVKEMLSPRSAALCQRHTCRLHLVRSLQLHDSVGCREAVAASCFVAIIRRPQRLEVRKEHGALACPRSVLFCPV